MAAAVACRMGVSMASALRRRWMIAGVVVVAVAAMLAVPIGARAADTAPVWSPLMPYGGASGSVTELPSISCASAGNCVAAGYIDTVAAGAGMFQGVVVVEHAGTWGPGTILTPPADDAAGEAQLAGISCSSATSCVAVGRYPTSAGGTQALVIPVTVNGASATLGAPIAFHDPADATTTAADADSGLNAISCTTGGCTAVGSYVDNSGGGGAFQSMVATSATWNAVKATAPAGTSGGANLGLAAVSCPAGGACEATGNDQDGGGKLVSWATQIDGGTPGMPVDVTMPTDSTPSPPAPPLVSGLGPINGLDAVSCPSAGACTAAGGYMTSAGVAPVAVPIVSGAPGTPVAVAFPPADSQTLISGISCSSASDCTAVGSGVVPNGGVNPSGDALVGRESGGVWSTLSPLTSNSAGHASALVGVGCAAPGTCIASGITENETAMTGQAFFVSSAPPLTADTSSLPVATVGQPYSTTLQAGGGTGSATWSISSGSLPAGLSLDAATGVIHGTPTAPGQTAFAATAADAGPPAQTAAPVSLTLAVFPGAATPTVAPPVITVGKLAVAYVNVTGPKATVVLFCTGVSCSGTLKLTGVEHLTRGKPTGFTPSAEAAAVKKKGKAKNTRKAITLATSRYSINAESTKAITLKVSGRGAKLLKQLGSLKATLAITPAGAAKPVTAQKLTFKSAAKKPARKKSKK